MTASKAQFLRDDKLAKEWVGIARGEVFAKVMIYARACLMESKPTQEALSGAESILNILATISDNDDPSPPIPNPGLHHDLDHLKRKTKG